MESINVKLDNLTQSEREQLMKLVEKGNKSKSKVWKPAMGEGYWVISTSSGVVNFIYNGDEIDLFCYSMGNCYPTEEAAEFAVEKQKVLTELQRYADEHNEGEIDWDNEDKDKYYLYYNHSNEEINVYANQYLQSSAIYFSSSNIGLEAVEAIGEDRIKKYLFNVDT